MLSIVKLSFIIEADPETRIETSVSISLPRQYQTFGNRYLPNRFTQRTQPNIYAIDAKIEELRDAALYYAGIHIACMYVVSLAIVQAYHCS